MTIKTKTFQFTPQQLKQLITSHYFRQRKRILIICLICMVIGTGLTIFVSTNFIGLAGYFGFLFIVLSLPPFLINMKKTQPIANFLPRYWEVDSEFITIYFEDGSLSKFRFEHLCKADKITEYYLLYLTPAGYFHYLPIAAFESEKDINRFELFLQGKQLIKLW
ncbi:YcxB family protein [Sphaerospermopsis aphanizomenoides BCCUSP55]|uniref:YcxB family protein n=1 Tax=Sphaerospermopsis aphanizomenoides TaxID=459663 RepID=UPI0019041B55|nr:YcxB family protein [Sphaerospermopsis aphanizomenoides]MBK1987147.1 YcxB family protein [Sphaerospermopsis aphanizomenoides BCCUSP55]